MKHVLLVQYQCPLSNCQALWLIDCELYLCPLSCYWSLFSSMSFSSHWRTILPVQVTFASMESSADIVILICNHLGCWPTGVGTPRKWFGAPWSRVWNPKSLLGIWHREALVCLWCRFNHVMIYDIPGSTPTTIMMRWHWGLAQNKPNCSLASRSLGVFGM